ncbi:dual oxidase maturation factor 1-like [Discoglossus pictus]
MTFYDGIHPFYPHTRKPWVFSVDLIIIIVVFLVFAIAFFIIVPGIRGKARIAWICRIVTSLFIGSVTLALNFTADWEVGSINTTTAYKSFSNAVVNADIGVHVGLSGVNVTLKGIPVHQINETINYNEQFVWSFGSDYNNYYDEGLRRGLPNPIMYVAEKFTQHSPCGLFAQYRISGHYASVCMWVAFCSWLICNILFLMPVLIYGAYMTLVTAAFIIFSLISFSTVRNVSVCSIQFGNDSLKIDYGGSFWLSLATGLLCVIIGVLLIILDTFKPNTLKIFFNIIEEDGDDLREHYKNPHYSSNETLAQNLDV